MIFSYIVTGVIFVYNSLIILLCVLAVYGAYALFRELLVILSRNKVVSLSVKVKDMNELQDMLSVAEYYTQKYSFFDNKVIVVCEAENAGKIEKYGFDVYVKHIKKESYDGEQ